MGRKRLTVAKKRVLRSATQKNMDFLVKTVPELQATEPGSSSAKKNILSIKETTQIQNNAVIADPLQDNYEICDDLNADGEDEKKSLDDYNNITSNSHIRTYRRRKTVDDIIVDWSSEDMTNTNNSQDMIKSNNDRSGFTCGMTDEASKYRSLCESQQQEIAKLKAQNAKLQDALTSKLLPEPELPFKDVEGDFLDVQIIRQLSVEAESDYLFVKFIMMRLWPERFVGRSVTGRPSNNPTGRTKSSKIDGSRQTTIGFSNENMNMGEMSTSKRPLEKEKVGFVLSCLYHRRIFLRDDPHTAHVHTKAGTSLMTRVIANSTRK